MRQFCIRARYSAGALAHLLILLFLIVRRQAVIICNELTKNAGRRGQQRNIASRFPVAAYTVVVTL
jgi:hypothetical protein